MQVLHLKVQHDRCRLISANHSRLVNSGHTPAAVQVELGVTPTESRCSKIIRLFQSLWRRCRRGLDLDLALSGASLTSVSAVRQTASVTPHQVASGCPLSQPIGARGLSSHVLPPFSPLFFLTVPCLAQPTPPPFLPPSLSLSLSV